MKRIIQEFNPARVFIGKIPIMIRSNFCHLNDMKPMEKVKNGKECQFDQGGYFVINGSEKVVIAQERMASNIVLVFHKKPPSKYTWVAEIRSQSESSAKPPQQFIVSLKSKVKTSSLL